MISKDTQFCISIAEKPSNFGTTLHNLAYSALNLDFIYKAFATTDLVGAISGVRALGIRGCSISMPYKKMAIDIIDDIDVTAQCIGAVNTIVNIGGRLTGYNTDLFGAHNALSSFNIQRSERVLLLGAGGVSRAILAALHQLGCRNIFLANRNFNKVADLNSIANFTAIPWSKREDSPMDFLINATPIGMGHDLISMPVSADFIQGVRGVMDVVVSPKDTDLIATARNLGKLVSPGYVMSLEQTLEQFFLYTGHKAPRDIMERAMRNLLLQ
jgi:shikimate dehydrogenase